MSALTPYRPLNNGNGKMTPDRIETILGAIRDGATHEDAAAEAGINSATLRRWLADGRAEVEACEKKYQEEGIDTDLGPLGDFSIEFYKAEAKVRRRMAKRLTDAADADPRYWLAAITYLQRRDPEHWHIADNVQVSATQEITIRVIRTDDWRNTNVEAGQIPSDHGAEIIEAQFADCTRHLPAGDAPGADPCEAGSEADQLP